MAKRKPVPPFLTLPEDGVTVEPASGWQFLREGHPPATVADGQLFPSWDSALTFTLRRKLQIDSDVVIRALGLEERQCRLALITRMETGRGLYSAVLDSREVTGDQREIEIVVSPDSARLSRDISLITTLILAKDLSAVGALSPSKKGSKVWESRWTSKLEGGRARLPIEAISFSNGMRGAANPNALFQVVVAEYPDLEFEQAVCVYLNSDFPQFVTALENAEPAATALFWDGVMRQLVGFGVTSAFSEEGEPWPQGSLGFQMRTWLGSIFPGQSSSAIASLRRDDPGSFEARVQSWVRAGPMWIGVGK